MNFELKLGSQHNYLQGDSQLLIGQGMGCNPSDWLKLWDKITLLNFNYSRAQEILEHDALYSVLCSYSRETVSQQRFNFENQ